MVISISLPSITSMSRTCRSTTFTIRLPLKMTNMFPQLSKIPEFQTVTKSTYNYVEIFRLNESKIAKCVDAENSYEIYRRIIMTGKNFKNLLQLVPEEYIFGTLLDLEIRLRGRVEPKDMTFSRACAGVMYVYYTNFIKDKELDVEGMIIPSLGDCLPRPSGMEAFHKMYCMAGTGIHFLPSLFFELHGPNCKEIGGTLALACMLDWVHNKTAHPFERVTLKKFLECKYHARYRSKLRKCINNLGEKVQELTEESLEYLFYAINNFTSAHTFSSRQQLQSEILKVLISWGKN